MGAEPDLAAQCRSLPADAYGCLRSYGRENAVVTEPFDPAGWLPRLESATSAFAATLDSADLARPVPGCPGWTLADLGGHLGGVHAWAEHAVVAGNPDLAEEPVPTGPGELASWYRDRAGSLLVTLAATDPDTPAWAFGLPAGRSEFWRRRQTHETTIHLWDAARSQDRWTAIDPVLAADGIDEVATRLFPRQVRLGRTTTLAGSVALAPTDVSTPGAVLRGHESDETIATVRGPAEVLLLLLWRRIRPDDARLTVTGSRAAYDDLFASALTP